MSTMRILDTSLKSKYEYKVLLDNKIAGYIEHSYQYGWRYVPKGGKKYAGEWFISLTQCVKSLEN